MIYKHWKGGMAGLEGSWTKGLVSKTLTVAAAVDLGTGQVKIPCVHGGDLHKFDYVVIEGTDYYDGNFLIVDIPDNNNFTIETAYRAETFAVSDTAKASNWQDENGFPAFIQTREPALKKGEIKTFSQELTLPEGIYRIIFEYDQQNDQPHGGAFENNYENFKGFKIDGRISRTEIFTKSARAVRVHKDILP